MKKLLLFFSLLVLTILVFGILCYHGILWPNSFLANKYSVHGIDVSNHQKEIDWTQVTKNEKIKFAFIKATEGKNYKDKYFIENWKNASQANLCKGAYHYFTISSSGKEQARNFIEFVPAEKGCLPPVIDIEERGLDKELFRKELREFITVLEEKYKQKPILYVVYSLYDEYIKGDFEQNPIWIRDIIKPPQLSDNREWIIWQYCDRGRVNGINSPVDLNVLNGDIAKLQSLILK